MDDIRIIENDVYLSYTYLSKVYDINNRTTEKWSERNIGKRIRVSGRVFIEFDTIPSATRKKLPSRKELISLAKTDKSDEQTERFFIQLERAYLNGFIQYREIYKALGCDSEKVVNNNPKVVHYNN